MNELKDKMISDSDPHLSYLLRRWHKISTAVYTITAHIKDSDQIKWNIRNRSLDIVSFMYEIAETHSGQKHNLVDACLKELEILISELSLATQAGLINRNNHSIVSEEVLKFSKEISEFRDKDAVLSPIQKDFMRVEPPVLSAKQQTGLLKDTVSDINKNIGQNEMVIKDKQKDVSQDKVRQERRALIIGLLKKTPNLGIKDFSNAIKNCSEKTIQRELISLVEDGVLYKTGERRWSTYSLINK